MPKQIHLAALVLTLVTGGVANCSDFLISEHNRPAPNREPLVQTPYIRLPIGQVKAEGWLKRQLELQVTGLTGASEELYDALQANSGWLGGDGESWERGPYYVKGLIALAFTLDDEELKQRAKKWVEWTLASQTPDGFFGPKSNDDWWPRMVVLYYLRDYYEATGDPRAMRFLLNYFTHQLATLPERPLRDWGRARAGDNIDVVLWTYNQTGKPFLLDLAKLLSEQAYPWTDIYTNGDFYGFGDDFHPHHIVNVSQALKFPAVTWQLSKQDADRRAFQTGVDILEQRYGRVDGQVSGTEMLSGRKSTDGVELCADVERILSNGIAITILGDADLGDQMEKVAYNSLPAHTTANLKQLTYYQFPNQVACTNSGHGFEQDYANANMPGPHSGFPCCCYNWHWGWPKFVQHMWAATADGGLAAMAYGPNRVTTLVNGDTPVTVLQETAYPFGEKISLTVNLLSPARFPLVLRIPGWCESPKALVNGQLIDGASAGGFLRIDRQWSKGDTVELHFPMKVRTSTWVNDSVALERGPLAFSLKIDEDWRRANDYANGFDEYEVLPESPWNYALEIDRKSPEVTVETREVPELPFDTSAAPIVLKVKARRVPEWKMRSLIGKVELGKANSGWQSLKELSLTSARSPLKLKVECKDQRLRVFVGDMTNPLFEQADGEHLAGSVGLRTYGADAQFENVRLDGQPVDSDSPNTNPWKPFGGPWSIEGGKLSVRLGNARSAKAVLDPATDLKDFTFEANVSMGQGGNAGLIFRASDVTDLLDGYRGYYVGVSYLSGSDEESQEPPFSPVASDEPLETVKLIPFGSTKLRVTYFPVLKQP